MENTDIPQFHTYRGEIEFEGTLIQADIFIDNKMLEDKNSLSCFIFAPPSSLESFHRMYLALNTRMASHGCKSKIVSSRDNKIVL